MIYVKDAFLLARTKLKLRIVRLSVTVFISSLLFAALIFIGTIAMGAVESARSFNKEGFSGRYIVSAKPTTYNISSGEDTTLITQLEPLQASLIASKKDAAKKLGIDYKPEEDNSLPIAVYKLPNGATAKSLNVTSLAVTEFVNKLNVDKKVLSYEAFQQTAQENGAVQTYRSIMPPFSYGGSGTGTYRILQPNKVESPVDNTGFASGLPKGLDSITAYGWSQFDESLLTPFVLPGQSLSTGADGSVPIIAPFSAAEEILGIQVPPATASTKEKIQHIQDVRTAIAGKTAQVCYRNSVSARLFQDSVAQQKDIEANKTTADYIKPTLIYQPPASSCAPTTIKSDTRSDEEKAVETKQKAFDKQFGIPTEQEQFIGTVRIVGLTSDTSDDYSFSAETVMRSVLQSSLGTGWFMPIGATSSNSAASKVFGSGDYARTPLADITYYAEFSSLDDASNFIKQHNCTQTNSFDLPPEGFGPCVDEGRPYMVMPYGNNIGAIEGFTNGFWNIAKYIIVAVIVFATLIMMGNVGKIITDSRRETAVFRALGAKRFDIAQVYLTYSLLLAILIFVCAAIIGIAGAMLVDRTLSPTASYSAVLAYNSSDITKQFHFFVFDIRIMLGVLGLVLFCAILSAVGPLLGNLKRNPIRDMRDEG